MEFYSLLLFAGPMNAVLLSFPSLSLQMEGKYLEGELALPLVHAASHPLYPECTSVWDFPLKAQNRYFNLR